MFNEYEYVNPFKDEINLKGMDIIATLGEKILKIEEFVQDSKNHKAVRVFEEGNALMNSWKNALALARPRRTWYGCMQYRMFARVEAAEILVAVYERKFNLFMNKWGIV
jgi:hypothetical protein